MKRRLVCTAGLVATWPAHAQIGGAVPRRIGFLLTGEPQPGEYGVVVAVREALAASGVAVQVHMRYGQDPAQLEAGARELLDQGVELIVAWFTPAAVAANSIAPNRTIVLGGVADPVATGLVPNLSAPGGYVTGVSAQATELAVKNLELLREWLPALRRVAVLAHATDPWAPTFVGALERAAPALGLGLLPGQAADALDYPALFARWAGQGAQALIVQPSLPFAQAILLAQRQRWPSCSNALGWPRRGGLFAYTVDVPAMNRMIASYVQRLLAGEAPARMPVQQVGRFLLVLNLRSARELGLTVPTTIRLRADEIIS